ncbi:hypothetical protein ACET3Z_010701 [Daucus carota]
MPWVAVPFSDSDARDKLKALFKGRGIPHLVLLDGYGKVLSDARVLIISEYGAEVYPHTSQHLKELKEHEEEAERNQSLSSILVSQSRDFVLSADVKKVCIFHWHHTETLLYSLESLSKFIEN